MALSGLGRRSKHRRHRRCSSRSKRELLVPPLLLLGSKPPHQHERSECRQQQALAPAPARLQRCSLEVMIAAKPTLNVKACIHNDCTIDKFALRARASAAVRLGACLCLAPGWLTGTYTPSTAARAAPCTFFEGPRPPVARAVPPNAHQRLMRSWLRTSRMKGSSRGPTCRRSSTVAALGA